MLTLITCTHVLTIVINQILFIHKEPIFGCTCHVTTITRLYAAVLAPPRAQQVGVLGYRSIVYTYT